MATFPIKRDPLTLVLTGLTPEETSLRSAAFPTIKTVPLDKDIGVFSDYEYLGTIKRQKLNTILLSIDAAFRTLREDSEWAFYTEQSNRIAAVQDLQDQLDAEIANRISDVDEEETRARAAEVLETSTRIISDGWLNNAISSERSPLKVLFQSESSYTINPGVVSQVNGLNNQIDNDIAIISGVYPTDFNGCSVDFATGTVVYNAGRLGAPANGSFDVPSLVGQANKWTKASIVLLPTAPDTLSINFSSSFGATAAATPDPSVTGGVPIAIVSLQVNSIGSAFVSGSQSNITQFRDLSPEDSTGGHESPLDPNSDESFLYYTRSDFAVERKDFIASTSGTDQVLGLGKIIMNAGQNFVSKDLTGSMIRTDAAVVNYAQAYLLYSEGKIDQSPSVEMSIDGGSSWAGNPSLIIAEGNHVVVDFTFPSGQALYTSGVPNSNSSSGQQIAAIIRPDYRTVSSSFQAYLKTTATAGTVTGKIYQVSSGIPSALVASAKEEYLAGQDIVSEFSYKSFTFAPVTLEANTDYALVVEGTGLNSNISWAQVTTAAATSVSSATHNGSGWTASAANLVSVVFGTGLDVRIKVTSSTNASELLGFGVNMVLNNQAGYSGEQSWEVRELTSTEAQTGVITLSSCRYTPGAHQLHANVGGHDFMAPDFVEVSPSSIQFPPSFLQKGDVVRFYVGYGVVDGSAVSLQKINTSYEAVVGNSAQVASGVATYTSIQNAINSVAPGGRIVILQGTFTENIILNKEVCIQGKGRSSIINGTVTFTPASNGSMLKFTKITDNVTIDLMAQAINVSDNWLAPGKSVTGGTNCFILNIGEN